MAEDLLDQIRLFLPKYLTPEKKEDLYKELESFPENLNYYLHDKREVDLLQGDGWRGFLAANFYTREQKEVSGVIISNTCDIDRSNPSPRERSILFSPLVSLPRYQHVLESKKEPDAVAGTLDAIRKQRITYIFYMPKYGDALDESIILLDDIHQHPLSHFLGKDKTKLFALSQYGFYLLLLKLSIHFSRFQEAVQRFD